MSNLFEQNMTKDEIGVYLNSLQKKEPNELTGLEASFRAQWIELNARLDEATELMLVEIVPGHQTDRLASERQEKRGLK